MVPGVAVRLVGPRRLRVGLPPCCRRRSCPRVARPSCSAWG